MKKITPVKVTLVTSITQDDQQEQFRFSEEGQFVNLNGKYYLRYAEHQDGSVTPVRFRFMEPKLQLQRSGTFETNLEFDMNQSTKTRYQTAYGIIILEVITTRLVQQFDPEQAKGSVQVSYQLKNGNQVVGTYQLELQFSA